MEGSEDQKYIDMALDLAEQGRGLVSPNPLVGAVVVKNNRIIGKGYHAFYGDKHAEIKALQEAGSEAKGATIYINLEPCFHQGKTPPCINEIIKAGITRAVIAIQDPNPLVNGKSISLLKSEGIDVELGIQEKAAIKLNEFFLKYIQTHTPFVILKSAMSLDGKVATKMGDSKWVTNEFSRRQVHRLRNQVDATIVGIETILRDNPQLTTRLKDERCRDPKRIIIDSLLRVPIKSRIFTQESKAENIIVTTNSASPDRIEKIEKSGGRVLFVKSSGRNRIDMQDMLKELGKLQITSLLIEGGPGINASAMEEGIVDKIVMFIAPIIIGGKGAPSAIQGKGVAILKEAVRIYDLEIKRLADDIMVEGYINKVLPCAWTPLGCKI